MATPRSVAELEAEMRGLVDPARAAAWSRAPGGPWRSQAPAPAQVPSSASTEKAPPAPEVMKHEAPMVLVKTEAPVQAKSATPQMAPSPATLADSRTASPAKGSSPAPASISPTPNGATKAPHQHREHGHHKTKTEKEKKHHHKHHRRNKHSEPTVPIVTAPPVAFVPPVGSSPLRSQESLTRVRQYQVRSEVEDPQSKAILAVTEQRRKQLDEERMQSLRHEERFMKRRDTKDVLPPPAVLPPEHLADRLVTLAAALRHSLAQLVRVIKDVAEGRAIAVDIDGCLPRIMLHVGESAALLTGDMKERVQKAAEEVTATTVNLSVLYRLHNADMDLNISAQHQELKRTIAALTVAMQAAIAQARALQQSSAPLGPSLTRQRLLGAQPSGSTYNMRAAATVPTTPPAPVRAASVASSAFAPTRMPAISPSPAPSPADRDSPSVAAAPSSPAPYDKPLPIPATVPTTPPAPYDKPLPIPAALPLNQPASVPSAAAPTASPPALPSVAPPVPVEKPPALPPMTASQKPHPHAAAKKPIPASASAPVALERSQTSPLPQAKPALTRADTGGMMKLSLTKLQSSVTPPPPPGLSRNRAERVRQSKMLTVLPVPAMLDESLSQGVRTKTAKPGAELWVPPFFMPYEKLKREPGATHTIEGIDSKRLEAYLKDDEFLQLFGMSKEEFYQLPGWRQRAIKINRKLW